jgi:hypothetical protein
MTQSCPFLCFARFFLMSHRQSAKAMKHANIPTCIKKSMISNCIVRDSDLTPSYFFRASSFGCELWEARV